MDIRTTACSVDLEFRELNVMLEHKNKKTRIKLGVTELKNFSEHVGSLCKISRVSVQRRSLNAILHNFF